MIQLRFDDDAGEDYNFKIEHYFTAGTTYILQSRLYGSSVGETFDVHIVKMVDAEEIQIIDGDFYSGKVWTNHQLSVEFLPDGAREEYLYWTSSDESIVYVDGAGYITLYKEGTATITVTSENGLSDSITVEVIDYPEITLDQEIIVSTDENAGTAIFSFVPDVTDVYAFYSYDNDFDTVGELYDAEMNRIARNDDYDDNNNFKVIYELTAGEKYYFKSHSYSSNSTGSYAVKLYRLPPATEMEICLNGNPLGYVGGKTYLWVEFAPGDCATETVTWSSSNASVATVDEEGNLCYVGEGSATITATSKNGLTDSLNVTVRVPDEISLNETKVETLVNGNGENAFIFTSEEAGQYIIKVNSEYSVETTVRFLESGWSVASSSGRDYTLFVNLNENEDYIISTLFYAEDVDSVDYTISIEKVGPATSLEITVENSPSGYPGGYCYLYSERIPEYSLYESVTWESSNPEIAEIEYSYDNYAKIRFISAGTATITATSENGLTDSIVITVYAPFEIESGETKTGTFSSESDSTVFSFTPEEDGQYMIRIGGEYYTETRVQEVKGSSSYFEEGNNYFFRVDMLAGENYIITTDYYDSGDRIDEAEYTISIEKLIPATSIEIDDEGSSSGYPGDYCSLYAIFNPENAIYESVTWESSNPEVAYINNTYSNSAELYFCSAGTATITVTSENGLTDSITITVLEPDEIALDEEVVVSVTGMFRFVPEVTGTYAFYSYDNDVDTYAVLYDADMHRLADNDDDGEGNNFKIVYDFTAGETYYFNSRPLSGDVTTGTYAVQINLLPAATSIEIDIDANQSPEGYAGETRGLIVKYLPENAKTEEITWSSSNPEIVEITDHGYSWANIRFVSPGTATITATSENGLTASITLTVLAPDEIALDEEIVVSGTGMFRFVPEATGTYSFYSYDNDCDTYATLYDANMDWIINNDDGGEDNNFKITYKLVAGETYYFKTQPANGTYTVQINVLPAATSMQISVDNLTGYVSRYGYLWVEFAPEDCAYENVTWSSSNPQIVEITYEADTSTDIRFVSPGTATITATSENGLTASCEVTVLPIPEIACDETKAITWYGEDACGIFSFVPDVDGTYMFYSFDANVGTCGEIWNADMEYITGDWYGDHDDYYSFRAVCEMTAGEQYYLWTNETWNNEDAQYNVKIVRLVPATSVNILSDDSITIYKGYDYRLIARFTPEFAIEEACTWQSNNTAVVTVDEEGGIYAHSAGTATITVTTENGLTDSVVVTVLAPTEIQLEETITGTFTAVNYTEVFSFTPDEDARYIIHIESNEYINAAIRDGDGDWLNGSEGCECSFTGELFAGESYQIPVYLWDEDGEYPENAEFEIFIEKIPYASSIEINVNGSSSGYVGEYRSFRVNYLPENAADEEITWTTSNPEIVEITWDGYSSADIRFVSPGTATITATSEKGLTDSITITVLEPDEIQLGETVTEVFTGPHYSKGFSFTPDEDAKYRITIESDYYSNLALRNLEEGWSTSTSGYDYSITEELFAGESYQISVYLMGEDEEYPEDAEFSITVEKLPQATAIEINMPGFPYGYAGEYRSLYVDYLPENAADEEITWSTSNSEIVEITYDGYNWAEIRFVSPGTATITATSENGLVSTCTVTVKNIDVIELDEEKVVTLNGENAVCYYFTPDEDGYYSFYSYDNDHDTFGYILDANMNELAVNDDGRENNNFDVRYELEAGVTYILMARFYDTDDCGSFSICVEERKMVTGLEIISMPEKTEYVSGCVGDALDYQGLKLRITWSDGTTTDWAYGNSWNIDGESLYTNTSDLEERGEVVFMCGRASVTVSFTLIENPVDHLELVSGTTRKYVENVNGGFERNDDGVFFFYDTYMPTDAVIKIVYKDGTTETAYVGTEVNDYHIDYYTNQYDEPWVVGTENEMFIRYLGHTVALPITVIENPVDHLELVSGTAEKYIENVNGYFTANESGKYFYYYTYPPRDAVIKIVYKDGTTETAHVGDDIGDYGIDCYTNQYDEPWVVGTENEMFIRYLGHTVTLPITIIENPVERIEINTAPTREYFYGDDEFGMLYGDIYEFYPTDLTGFSFTVYYTNGTSKLFTDEDIEDGPMIDGYRFWLIYDSWNPGIGDFPVTFEYMGMSFEYTVKLLNHQHTYDSGVVTKEATCKEEGVMTFTCSTCSDTKTEPIAKLTTHTYDHACDTSCNVCGATRAITHTYTTTTTKATLTTDGSIVKACTVCNHVASTTVIAKPTTFTLSTTAYTYNGQVKKPAVTVKDANGNALVSGTDYTVTYPSGRTALGSYNITVTMKGNYSGTKTLTFTIGLATPNVTVANATNGVKISWNAISGAKNYRVYKSVYSGGKWSAWTTIKTGVTGTTYTDTSVKSNDNVKYTVRAFNGSYSSTYKSSSSIKFLATPTVTVSNATNGVKISWNAIAGTKTYTVYKSVYTNGAWSGWKAIKTGVTATTYTDTSVKSNNNVKYTVRAFNGNFSSTFKSSSSIKFLATPTVTVSNATNGVKISWNKIAGAKTYTVYKSTYSGGKWSGWKAIKTGVTGTTYTDTSVKSNNNVKYTVKAINSSFTSYIKSSASIKFLATPTVKAANAAKGVTVTWNKIAGAKTYTVYRSVYSGGKWSGWKAIKTGVTGTSYTDTTVKSGATVKYTVRAVNSSFQSSYAGSNATKFLAQPSVKVAKATNGIKATWGKSAGATGYIVYRRTYSNGKWSGWQQVKITTGLSFTDITAKKGVTYQYAVRAYSGNYKSSYTNSSSIKR